LSERNRIFKKIEDLKKKRNAIILAHVYQRDEVQDIADFTGDSLALSKIAVNTNAKVIIFCGVRFMAETAAILNPDKIVLLPEKDAGCPLADKVTVEALRSRKKEYPQARVVSYINSPATVKAESDIVCTSSNAVDVVNSLKERKILFIPDMNLGKFVSARSDKEIILWDGFCYVHHNNIKAENIEQLKLDYPQAKVVVHPECQPEVVNLADYVGSTAKIASYVYKSKAGEFIIGTEMGILHPLRKKNPRKKFYSPSSDVICQDMKLTTLEKIVSALENMQYQIDIPERIANKAKRALDRMLKVIPG